MIGYCYYEYDPAFDPLSIAVPFIIALIAIVLGGMMSISSFRRLDL
jgi:ABC-type antimicrobial peptide transport system permease subunit